MATHSSDLAWRIPWTEEPGGLYSMGSQELDMTQRLNNIYVSRMMLGRQVCEHLRMKRLEMTPKKAFGPYQGRIIYDILFHFISKLLRQTLSMPQDSFSNTSELQNLNKERTTLRLKVFTAKVQQIASQDDCSLAGPHQLQKSHRVLSLPSQN